jgi:hypothetical protein
MIRISPNWRRIWRNGFRKNAAQAQMYDPKTGRGFDGILSEKEINRNAGAESTIEALYAILEVEANPVARQKLHEKSQTRINPLKAKSWLTEMNSHRSKTKKFRELFPTGAAYGRRPLP